MSSLPFSVVVLLAFVMVVAVLIAADRRPKVDDLSVMRVGRRTLAARWAGLVAGTVAGMWVWRDTGLGTGPMLAVPAVALPVLVGVLVGEYLAIGPMGATRTAALTRRAIRDYLPTALAPAVAGAAVLTVLLLVATTTMGSADDMGRAGRSLSYRCVQGSSGAVGPWPGSFYTVPLAAMLLPTLALAFLGLRAVVLRPRAGAMAIQDDALRRDSATVIVAACGVAVGTTMLGVTAVGSMSLQRVTCPSSAMSILRYAMPVTTLGYLAVAVWSAAVLMSMMFGRPVRLAGARR